jgi:hypothetical protein
MLKALDCTHVLRDYENIIAEDGMIETIMGSSYDKGEKPVM